MIERQWRRIARAGAAVAGAAVLAAAVPAMAQQQQQRQPPPQQQQRQPAPPAQQQQGGGERVQVVNLDQALLERWIVLFGDLAPKLGNAQTQNLEPGMPIPVTIRQIQSGVRITPAINVSGSPMIGTQASSSDQIGTR